MSHPASDHARIAATIRFLVDRAADPPSLAETAAHVGLSEFHFQRLFHDWAGVTPKTLLQVLALQAARAALAPSGATPAPALLDASLALGLSSPGRLHDLFVQLEAMTPGEYRSRAAGVTVRWALLPTAFGSACFAATDRGLCGLSFQDDAAAAASELAARWPGARLQPDPDALAPWAEALEDRLRGRPPRPLAVLLKGTPFQVKVWEALLRLPDGATLSYGELAGQVGAPGAARAVGSAVGANPIAVLIPCHRVIRQSGVLGDYRWGAGRKRTLLALERARMAA